MTIVLSLGVPTDRHPACFRPFLSLRTQPSDTPLKLSRLPLPVHSLPHSFAQAPPPDPTTAPLLKRLKDVMDLLLARNGSALSASDIQQVRQWGYHQTYNRCASQHLVDFPCSSRCGMVLCSGCHSAWMKRQSQKHCAISTYTGDVSESVLDFTHAQQLLFGLQCVK
jgi:hypothetical protein